jgi:hypothetical protein
VIKRCWKSAIAVALKPIIVTEARADFLDRGTRGLLKV